MPEQDATAARPTRVWDLPTRLFHWSLVALVTFSGLSGQVAEDLGSRFMDWHMLSGYAILALLLFRLAWGFVGSTHARFADFVRGPRRVLEYLGARSAGKPDSTHPGHNPLGGWSVLSMLGALSVQVGSGLFLSDEDMGVEGPLAKHVANRTIDLLHEVHETSFWLVLGLVAAHLAAIAFYRVAKGENLVRPMVTGDKVLAGIEPARGGAPWLGALWLALTAGAVWYLVNRV